MTTAITQSIYGNIRSTLVIPANSMTAGETYTFRMTVISTSNSSIYSSVDAVVYAQLSPISGLIIGGDLVALEKQMGHALWKSYGQSCKSVVGEV